MNVGWYAVVPCGQQRAPRALVAVAVGAAEVDAGEPVDLEVDEPGRGEPAPAPGQADRHDPVAVDLDVAGNAAAVHQRRRHPEPHAEHRSRAAPPARCPSRRYRASWRAITTRWISFVPS